MTIWRSGSSVGVEKIPGRPLVDEWYCPRLLSRLARLSLFLGFDSSINHLFLVLSFAFLVYFSLFTSLDLT
jgi:hypothetical protein